MGFVENLNLYLVYLLQFFSSDEEDEIDIEGVEKSG